MAATLAKIELVVADHEIRGSDRPDTGSSLDWQLDSADVDNSRWSDHFEVNRKATTIECFGQYSDESIRPRSTRTFPSRRSQANLRLRRTRPHHCLDARLQRLAGSILRPLCIAVVALDGQVRRQDQTNCGEQDRKRDRIAGVMRSRHIGDRYRGYKAAMLPSA